MGDMIVSPWHDSPPPAVLARATSPEEPGDEGSSSAAAAAFAFHSFGMIEQWRERVTPQTALTYSAVWGCVRIIAQTLASIGWHVWQRQPGSRERLPIEDNIAWTLNMQSSPEMTAFDWRQVMLKDALLWGNGYSEIERTNSGKVLWLWRIDPQRVTPERDARGRLYYRITNLEAGEPDSFLRPENMFHLKGLGPDGIVGYSVVELARRSIRLGLQEERFGSEFFSRGPTPGGVLKVPGAMRQEERDKLRESFQATYGGAKNAGRVVVLTGGMEFAPLTLPNEDAQWLEGRTFQVSEICRWYGVPPHKLADLSRATFSNIEEQERSFVADCLLPWARRLESEADVKLYGSVSMGRRFTRLNLDALQRGNSQTQTETVTKKVQTGLMTPNEGREYFDLNPDPDGDTLLVQGALVPLETVLNPPEPPAPPAPQPEPAAPDDAGGDAAGGGDGPEMAEDLRKTLVSLFGDLYGRMLRGEASKATLAKRDGRLKEWAAGNYGEQGGGSVARVKAQVAPLVDVALRACGGPAALAASLAERLARDHNAASKAACGLNGNGRAPRQAESHVALIWEQIHG